MKIGEAFTYLRSDPDWVSKFTIACLLSLTVIGFIPVMGWAAEITHRMIHKRQDVVPGWSDLGELTVTGLKVMAINLVWWLPVAVIYIPFFLFVIVGPLAGEFLPNAGDTTVFLSFTIANFCLTPLVFILQLCLMALSPAYHGHFAVEKSVADGLNFKAVWMAFKVNWANFVVAAILGTWVPGMLASIGMFFFCVGYFIALVYGQTVKAYLNATVFLDTQARMAEA